jgi:hypothetical protein
MQIRNEAAIEVVRGPALVQNVIEGDAGNEPMIFKRH